MQGLGSAGTGSKVEKGWSRGDPLLRKQGDCLQVHAQRKKWLQLVQNQWKWREMMDLGFILEVKLIGLFDELHMGSKGQRLNQR